MPDIDLGFVVLLSVALVLGGLVKGVTGIGLPIVSTAVLSSFLPGQIVLGLLALPLLLTNLWQALRAGDPWAPLRRFWPVTAALMVAIWLAARQAAQVDSRVIYAVVGIAVILFLVAGRLTRNIELGPRAERWIGPIAGVAGGCLGGLSTIWGPPVVLYFLLLRLEKDEFVQTVGWVWLLTSIPLVIGYVSNGILSVDVGVWSLAAAVPAVVGFLIGQAVRDRIDEARFQAAVRLFLFVIAVNLLRRAFFA